MTTASTSQESKSASSVLSSNGKRSLASSDSLVFVEDPSLNNIIADGVITSHNDTTNTTTTNSTTPSFPINSDYIGFLNQRLASLSPQEIIEWALVSLPGLVQSTAFGLTGCAILDMITKISAKRGLSEHPVPLIFIDTLYHFKETLELADRASKHYNLTLHTFNPLGFNSTAEFEAHHGERLWERDADVYDYLVKVEPGRRSALQFNARCMITGRRRSQGASRANIPILEVDSSVSPPMLKLNVLASWDYDQVWEYIQTNNVPYNPLTDQGYKSVGDWHSTQPTAQGQSEREGRWAGQAKTECGLHKDYFKMRASYLAAKKKQQRVSDKTETTTAVDTAAAQPASRIGQSLFKSL